MMVRFTLRQLQAFVAVAEAGTIAHAADGLGLSPSAVTSALNELERVLDAQLTTRRKSHGVVLTPSGEHVLVEARNLLNMAEGVQQAVRADGAELSGRARIGSYEALAPTMLVDLMSAVAAEHPAVGLDFVADIQDRICADVLEGYVDVALVYDLALPSGLDRVYLRQATPVAVLHPDHPLAAGPSVSLAQLAAEPMILLDTSPSRENTVVMFREAGVTPRIDYRTTDVEVTRSLVARGMGYAILATRPAGDQAYSGQPVAVRPITPAVSALPVVLVSNPRLRLSRPAAAIMEIAQRLWADRPERSASPVREGPPVSGAQPEDED